MRPLCVPVLVGLLLLAGILIPACSPPPPPPPQPVGPQTKEEVFALVSPIIEPLRKAAAPGGQLPVEAERNMLLGQLRDAVGQYGNTDFGKAALREVGYEISEIAKKSSDQERWRMTLLCVDAYGVLSMDGKLIGRLNDRAKNMLAQPSVRVHGFLEDGDNKDLYVFLDIVDRKTGEVKKVQAREGEEFDGLRLLKVMGRNQKVRMEYLKIPGLIFDIDFDPSGV